MTNQLLAKIFGFFAFALLAVNPVAAESKQNVPQSTEQQDNQDQDLSLEILEDDEVMPDAD
jgi:hypothetical protein